MPLGDGTIPTNGVEVVGNARMDETHHHAGRRDLPRHLQHSYERIGKRIRRFLHGDCSWELYEHCHLEENGLHGVN